MDALSDSSRSACWQEELSHFVISILVARAFTERILGPIMILCSYTYLWGVGGGVEVLYKDDMIVCFEVSEGARQR